LITGISVPFNRHVFDWREAGISRSGSAPDGCLRQAYFHGGILVLRQAFQPPSPRILSLLAWAVGGALMLAVVGYWSVRFAVPRGEARPALALPKPAEAAQAITTRHLFGRGDKAAATSGDAGAVRVLGVASSDGAGGAFAIVSVDGKPPIPAIEGQEFGPGLRLTRVTSTGIEYQRGGMLQSAPLQEKRIAVPSPLPVPQVPVANLPPPSPSVNVPVVPAPPAPAS
jgi:hypothetical protein